MKRQRGLSLISTLIVGAILVAALMLGLKLVPVYSEFFAVKKAFNNVVTNVDAAAAPAEFRNAFSKYAEVDNIDAFDARAIQVTKSDGKAQLQVSYRKEVHLFANVSLAFDFDVTSGR